MKKTTALGICLIIGIEVLALTQHDRRFVLAASGIGLALVLLSMRRTLGRGHQTGAEADADDLGDSLRRWLSTTETTIRWAEATRADWDRHLRPMLARRYEIATGQRQAKGSRGIPRDRSNALRCRTVGMGQPQQRHPQWRPPTGAGQGGPGRDPAKVGTGMTEGAIQT